LRAGEDSKLVGWNDLIHQRLRACSIGVAEPHRPTPGEVDRRVRVGRRINCGERVGENIRVERGMRVEWPWPERLAATRVEKGDDKPSVLSSSNSILTVTAAAGTVAAIAVAAIRHAIGERNACAAIHSVPNGPVPIYQQTRQPASDDAGRLTPTGKNLK
jgi:hypothetical protein